MKEETKQIRIGIMNILGNHIVKYINIYIFVTAFIILFDIFLISYWHVDNTSYGFLSDTMYLVAYYYSLVLSIASITGLILRKTGKITTLYLAISAHIYGILIYIWGVFVSLLDLDSGISPVVFLSACIFVAGLLVIEPVLFTSLTVISVVIILSFDHVNNYNYFNGAGEIFNFIMCISLISILSFRHYRVIIREAKGQKRLEQLTYYDDLTGLLNERSYMMEVDKINKLIQEGKAPDFAIVVMDVNNVKVTNDTYGHRFGCHLIVRCGHILPSIFKTSKVFHVGGDEFIAILYGEDLNNIEARLEHFDRELRYSIIEFEEKELIFSIARGYSKYDGGEDYRSTFQTADKGMYDNKVSIKSQYNMKGR